MVVVLPQPLPPRRPKISPFLTSKLRFLITFLSPKAILKFFTSINVCILDIFYHCLIFDDFMVSLNMVLADVKKIEIMLLSFGWSAYIGSMMKKYIILGLVLAFIITSVD